MSQIFETVMLLCFGASWPMALVKNFKARSAKGMSLPFLILITSGYIFGISAKLVTDNYSYVLWVYALNLAIVSMNLIVYFRNLNLDRGISTSKNPKKVSYN